MLNVSPLKYTVYMSPIDASIKTQNKIDYWQYLHIRYQSTNHC